MTPSKHGQICRISHYGTVLLERHTVADWFDGHLRSSQGCRRWCISTTMAHPPGPATDCVSPFADLMTQEWQRPPLRSAAGLGRQQLSQPHLHPAACPPSQLRRSLGPCLPRLVSVTSVAKPLRASPNTAPASSIEPLSPAHQRVQRSLTLPDIRDAGQNTPGLKGPLRGRSSYDRLRPQLTGHSNSGSSAQHAQTAAGQYRLLYRNFGICAAGPPSSAHLSFQPFQ
jgi:hypothetical protein